MTNPSALLAGLAKARGVARRIEIADKITTYWLYEAQENAEQAPTILMIHGYRGNHHGLEAIAGAMTDLNVIIPDLPGFGESEAFDESHTIDRYAQWVGGFISALSTPADGRQAITPSQITLLGHSFGTIVVSAALAVGLAKPARVVLINPVSAPALSGPRSFLTKISSAFYWIGGVLPSRLGTAWLSSPVIVRGMSILLAKTNDRELRSWIHREHDENFSIFESSRVAYEGYQASVSHNVGEYAARLKQPTLLLIGDLDDITSVENQHIVQAKFANAQLQQLDGVGHLTHYEAPLLAARFIRDFIELDSVKKTQ